MSTYSKFITIVILLAAIGGWFGFKHYESELSKARGTNAKIQMQADLSIGRANTSLEEANKHIKELDAQIQKDIKDKDAKLDSIGEIEATNTVHNSGKLITPTIAQIMNPNTPIDKCIFISTLPFSYEDFRLNVSGDAIKKTFEYTLNQKFEIIVAETKSNNGAVNNYAELYELDGSGKRINKLQLTKFNVYKNPIDPKKFKWWDPAIDILAGGILSTGYNVGLNGNLGVSFFSYGRYRNLDYRFLRLAVGIDKGGLELSLSPAQYNFAQPLPFVNNLWITPQIGYNLDVKTYFLGLGIAALL